DQRTRQTVGLRIYTCVVSLRVRASCEQADEGEETGEQSTVGTVVWAPPTRRCRPLADALPTSGAAATPVSLCHIRYEFEGRPILYLYRP
ncbi:MAG: hypothetical protein KAJ17_02355, partial [Candidatus Krumholzibacteria bacterium]|nr:hypothetical protein [Candidatus Krumholzibacteria bacterium]